MLRIHCVCATKTEIQLLISSTGIQMQFFLTFTIGNLLKKNLKVKQVSV